MRAPDPLGLGGKLLVEMVHKGQGKDRGEGQGEGQAQGEGQGQGSVRSLLLEVVRLARVRVRPSAGSGQG